MLLRRLVLVALVFAASRLWGQSELPPMKLDDFAEVAAHHPAGEALAGLFPTPPAPLPEDFQPTGLTRQGYLRLIAGNVDFWKQHQSADGAILDFHEKNSQHPQGQEKQYSTPAFALAAAALVKHARRDDLLNPAVRAFGFALDALVNQTTADGHPDFYIPMLMHAHRILKSRVEQEMAAKWERQLKAIVPQQVYRDTTGNGNWNIVNVAGEALRRRDGLVADDLRAAQQDYLDRSLERQQRLFTRLGMYAEADVPLAYDAFPRMWLEDMIADGAYEGPQRTVVERFLVLGGFSTLLLMSPQGEWASGGRSSHHQWNEAQCAVIGECNAGKWKAAGRDDIAGSFKRMARMATGSMLRWQRASGEMWIVKNRAEPHTRLGFEDYSYHSQYNLLAAAMLAIAYEHADDTIEERPLPAEYGSYVFDLRDPFTKVAAASGGYYVLIDTAADPDYNATGLQRVHRRGTEISPLSDSAAEHRRYQAGEDDPHVALAPCVQWKDGEQWIGLPSFHRAEPPPQPGSQRTVKQAHLSSAVTPQNVTLNLVYELDGPGARKLQQGFIISSDGVVCSDVIDGATTRFVFPALVNDGAADTTVNVQENKLTIALPGGILNVALTVPPAKLTLVGPRIPTHNGYVQSAAAENVGDKCTWRITLAPSPSKNK